ncbi:MAG: GTP cyclohydrolase MptA [Candidatus Jordarchaeum sp.]|uniref:GTP cyclohydrolase MptA n=1 Tax=Candidatus Jordarchaeum sp. TaxID=2823881 RepID=UPI00404B9E40
MMLPDVQNQEALLPIGLDKVGLVGIVKRVKVTRDKDEFILLPSISAFIDLPQNMRGIHMSRSIETIEGIIEEISYRPARSIEGFCEKLVKTLLEKHDYASHAEVTMESPLVLDIRSEEEEVKRQKTYSVYAKGMGERRDGKIITKIFLGVGCEGMTVCPCGQEITKDYSKTMLEKRARELKIDEETIDKILNLIPIASHSQRCRAKILIETPKENVINIRELARIIEESMSGITQDILKRPDEARLIRIAHLNPKFIEDTAREVIYRSAQKFKDLPDTTEVSVEVESMESVHGYNAFAAKSTTLGKIKETLESEFLK